MVQTGDFDSDFCMVDPPQSKETVDYKNPQTSPVYSTVLPNGETVAWAKQYECSGTMDKNVREIAKVGSGYCNTCACRASKLTGMFGPSGPLLFHGEFGGETTAYSLCYQHELRKYANTICGHCSNDNDGNGINSYKLVLVTTDTFPNAEYTGPGGQAGPGPFYHMTIVPDCVTSAGNLTTRMQSLWLNVQYNVKERLAKFLTPEARASMKIIEVIVAGRNRVVDNLERPDYWKATCNWIVQLQCKFGKDFVNMTREEQDEMCIYAMATGYARGSVHFNFQTAANLLDFMVMTSVRAIRDEMDKRSDPRTNQISQLARAKAAKGVVNNYGVGLIWDGKVHRDDLDLHVQTPWGKVCYNQKQLHQKGQLMAKLDFDAGINGNEAEPAENVTLNDSIAGKKVQILIDNYTRRTRGDVDCSIVITQQGDEDIVLPVVWPKNRRKGNLLHVCSHTFTEIVKPDVALTEGRARAAVAQDAEFQKLFGVPNSVVATVNDLKDFGVEMQQLADVASKVALKSCPVNTTTSRNSATALSEFNHLASVAAASNGKNSKKKAFISDCVQPAFPQTMDELWQDMTSGTITNLSIHLPDHVPGYITRVTVASSEALATDGHDSVLAPCHFQDKTMHPIQPVKTGNARLDSTWVNGIGTSQAKVAAVTKMAGRYFLVLHQARLPSNNADFPLSAGCYPQDLSADGYKHRSKWSYLHTSVHPQMQSADSGIPLIGTFLTSDTATLFVNGRKLVLSTA